MSEKVQESAEVERINMTIAAVIRNIRKRKGLTQAALSKISGVSVGSIKRFEKTGNISLASFSKIAIAMGLETELTKLFQDAKLNFH